MTLSKRIAALEGPDRAIDAVIAKALGWSETKSKDGTIGGPWVTPDFSVSTLPYFSASIDAALSIVEPSMQDYIMDEAMKRVDSRVVIIGKFNEQLARAICEVALEGKGL